VIREYFSEFGNIAEVNMQGFKKNLAVIKFEDHDSAHRAWSSPKAIFDNRFVKVYWHKAQHRSDTNGQSAAAEQDTPMFDKEEFEKQQAEAQKLHEERMQKRKEAEEARLALEKQREELMRKQQEEKTRLLKRLGGSAAGAEEAGLDTNGSAMVGVDESSEQTKSLRAQLAALEAEAKSLGIDPNNSSQSFRGRGRGRGVGGYRGRGRGFDPSSRGSFRGTYRGRGAPRGVGRGGVLRLDNRPKRVAISGVDFNSEKDEALRQYLIVSFLFSFYLRPLLPRAMLIILYSRVLVNTNPSILIQTDLIPWLSHSRSATLLRSSCLDRQRFRL
jgi:RNA recognition motif. (a.k.a. RRM, RBD, or RNP domain)